MLGSADLRLVLLVRARRWRCALPAADVVETLRTLPIVGVTGAPGFVRGLSIVRGAPIPVVDLAALLGSAEGGRGSRFVVMRAGARRFALEVDEVAGLRQLDAAALEPTAPLLGRALPGAVELLGELDGHALAVLDAARLLPEQAWLKPAPEATP